MGFYRRDRYRKSEISTKEVWEDKSIFKAKVNARVIHLNFSPNSNMTEIQIKSFKLCNHGIQNQWSHYGIWKLVFVYFLQQQQQNHVWFFSTDVVDVLYWMLTG